MIHWQQYNDNERMQLLDIASAEKKLPRLAIEKDWWVSVVLKAMSMTQYADYCLRHRIIFSPCKDRNKLPFNE